MSKSYRETLLDLFGLLAQANLADSDLAEPWQRGEDASQREGHFYHAVHAAIVAIAGRDILDHYAETSEVDLDLANRLHSQEKRAIASHLESLGDQFSGGTPRESLFNAQLWIDQDFDLDGVVAWTAAGFWDAMAAWQVLSRGLTSTDAAQREWDLATLHGPDRYTDGSPIYALCNGDIGIDHFTGDEHRKALYPWSIWQST